MKPQLVIPEGTPIQYAPIGESRKKPAKPLIKRLMPPSRKEVGLQFFGTVFDSQLTLETASTPDSIDELIQRLANDDTPIEECYQQIHSYYHEWWKE